MQSTISPQAVMIAVAVLSCLGGEPFDLFWNTIDGGGVMHSTSDDGRFVLSGTIGQPDAAVLTGGNLKLTGGFWFETPPTDCNADGIVGLSDHQSFVNCLTGPAGDPTAECACFDVDGDGRIDLADFAENQTDFLGE